MKKSTTTTLVTLFVFFILTPQIVVNASDVDSSYVLATKTAEAAMYGIESDASTDHDFHMDDQPSYRANPIQMTSFWDAKDAFNVASYDDESHTLCIQRYDSSFNPIANVKIANSYEEYGNVIIDRSCNYYVIWGQYVSTDHYDKGKDVIIVNKYDYNGTLVGECRIKSQDTATDKWGNSAICKPFKACDVRMAINNDILTCCFAKERKDGHQSNYVIWIDTSKMTRKSVGNADIPYTSHCFYNNVIATSDGGFLYANQGDGSDRGYNISKITPDFHKEYSKTVFHFHEGSETWTVCDVMEYNYTHAQLGGLVETNNAYVLCASSEKRLSLSPAVGLTRCEARNLFIQIFKKDNETTGEDSYYVGGETRVCTGAHTSYTRNRYLSGEEKNYGVIWLTDLPDDMYVANPKIVSIDGSSFALLWEELSYSTGKGSTYIEILNENAQVIKEKTLIDKVELCNDTQPVYHNGKIYWSVANERTSIIGWSVYYNSTKAICEVNPWGVGGTKIVGDIDPGGDVWLPGDDELHQTTNPFADNFLPAMVEAAIIYPDTKEDPSTLDCKFYHKDGKSYWYENGVRQGTLNDPKGVMGFGTNRGREICDMETEAWYWCDSVYDGAKAVNKEVWMPYIYQDEKNWDYEKIKQVAAESGNMSYQVRNSILKGTGKWVRYNSNGKMYKGWYKVTDTEAQYYPNNVGDIYYYDPQTGLMAHGDTVVGGILYCFDDQTGVLQGKK